MVQTSGHLLVPEPPSFSACSTGSGSASRRLLVYCPHCLSDPLVDQMPLRHRYACRFDDALSSAVRLCGYGPVIFSFLIRLACRSYTARAEGWEVYFVQYGAVVAATTLRVASIKGSALEQRTPPRGGYCCLALSPHGLVGCVHRILMQWSLSLYTACSFVVSTSQHIADRPSAALDPIWDPLQLARVRSPSLCLLALFHPSACCPCSSRYYAPLLAQPWWKIMSLWK